MKKRYYIPILLLVAEEILTFLFPEVKEAFYLQSPVIQALILALLFSPVWALIYFLSRDLTKPKVVRVICTVLFLFSVLCFIMAFIAEILTQGTVLCVEQTLECKAIKNP